MSVILPKEIAYQNQLPSLPPDTVNTSIVLSPVNGATFALGSGQLIQFDLPSRGFLDPASLYIRYTWNIQLPQISDPSSANFTAVAGTPLYTPFVKLETIFGSQIVESINNYNVVQNMLIVNSLNFAQKNGLANQLGYADENDLANFNFNSRPLQQTAAFANIHNFGVAGPLNCLLANCSNLYPLFSSPNVRIQLSLDSISNCIKTQGTNVLPTNVFLSNIELCFDMVDFGGAVENMVRQMGEKIYIKSESYACAQQQLASFQGTAELNYNMRLSSIKSLWAINGGTTSINGLYDSFDITQRITNYTNGAITGGGSYIFSIAGKNFPDRALSTSINKQAIMVESQMAKGHAINEVGIADVGIFSNQLYYANNAGASLLLPAQFFVGVNTEKLRSNNVLLSGTSTNNSNITYRVECTNSTGSANSILLVAVYDALIEIDTMMRNASVKQ